MLYVTLCVTIIWWSIGWTSLKPISYSATQLYSNISTIFLPFQIMQSVWYFSGSHGCITCLHCDKTSLNLSDVMHIVERLTTGPSDVIAPVGVTSSRRYRIIAPISVMSSWRCRIICDITAELWDLNFWIKFATIQAKNTSKCSHLVSCDKQKTALVFF
jgi:hypothetical protein